MSELLPTEFKKILSSVRKIPSLSELNKQTLGHRGDSVRFLDSLISYFTKESEKISEKISEKRKKGSEVLEAEFKRALLDSKIKIFYSDPTENNFAKIVKLTEDIREISRNWN